jgi:signal transduction histidine kinase
VTFALLLCTTRVLQRKNWRALRTSANRPLAFIDSQQLLPVALAEILDNVLELQSRRLQLNGIAVEKQYRCDGVVQGFAVELKQVFLNMIGNAVQAMPFGGRLRVRLCRSLEWSTGRRGVRFSAHDTGQGIRPEHAKRIFEPLTLPGSVFRVRIRRDAASRVSLVSSAVHRGV